MDRKEEVKQLAEDKAMELIRAGLVTDDELLAPVCKKLERFKSFLAGHVDEDQARNLLRTGFGMVSFSPEDGASDELEVSRILEKLANRLKLMAPMLGL